MRGRLYNPPLPSHPLSHADHAADVSEELRTERIVGRRDAPHLIAYDSFYLPTMSSSDIIFNPFLQEKTLKSLELLSFLVFHGNICKPEPWDFFCDITVKNTCAICSLL